MKKISNNLKEAGFIVCKKPGTINHEGKPIDKRPVTNFEGDDWNEKVINFEEANNKLQEGFNISLVAGINDIVVLDCDKLELGQYAEGKLPKTYTEATTSSGMHYIFKYYGNRPEKRIDIKWHKQDLGELRLKRSYVVISPSKAINKEGQLKPYEIVKDLPLATITDEDIEALLKEFESDKSQTSTSNGKLSLELAERVAKDSEIYDLFEGKIKQFASRSEAEQSLTNKLRARDFTKEEALAVVLNSKIGKLKEKPISYWEMMWEKALGYVTTGKKEYIENAMEEAEELDVIDVLGVKNHKVDKNYLIKDLKFPGESEMIVAPSRHGKSTLALYQAICIASGKSYLNEFKTKKSSVLFVSAETSKDWLKTNLLKILKGLNIRSNKIPLYFLTRDRCEDLMNPKFMARLFKTIREKNIKVVYFDTINPLTPSLDDNSARDVTRLFNEFLKPLIDKFGVNVTYLHHTDKKESAYLGSVKWLANSDSVFRINRKDLSSRITIYNEKNRRGETEILDIEIIFEDNKIVFRLLGKQSAGVFKQTKMSQQEFFILKLNKLCEKGMERKEIIDIFKQNKITFSTATLDRALKQWRN